MPMSSFVSFRKLLTRSTPFIILVLLPSCAGLAPSENRTGDIEVPPAYTLYEDAAPAPDRWWETFSSEELNRLVEKGLQGNLSLKQIYARVTQAEMIARQAGAALHPNLTFTTDVSATRRRVDTGESADEIAIATNKINALDTLLATASPASLADAAGMAQSGLRAAQTLLEDSPSSSAITTARSYRFGLSSAYEADVWGRLRAQEQAARLDYEATREDLYAAMLSLSGTVVRQWLVIAAQREGLDLVQKQLDLNKTTLELMELRYRKGLATALDVFQQRQIVAQTESLVPPLESALQTAQHELAVLLGGAPRAGLAVTADSLPVLGEFPEPGVPADLLARRPDVRAAGLDLQAADWRVSAARADRLPALRLTASASYGAEKWALVFDNWMATLAGSLTGPLFDAGRRKAEVERTRAVAAERLARYQESVLQSVKEVENALLQESKQAEYIDALKREIEVVRATHEQALQRYRKGLNDYLPVLSALTQLQVLERRLVVAEFERLEDRVAVCLALGGSWMNDTVAEAEGSNPGMGESQGKIE